MSPLETFAYALDTKKFLDKFRAAIIGEDI